MEKIKKYFIIIFIYSITISIFSFSQNEFSKKHYAGIIGEKLNISMDLTISGSNVTGYYAYVSVGQQIILKGSVQWASIDLAEEVDGKKTGIFKGKFENSDKIIKGEWSTFDGKKKFPFSVEQVAEYKTLKNEEYNVSIIYPKFSLKQLSIEKEINQNINRDVNKAFEESVKSNKETIDELKKEQDSSFAEMRKNVTQEMSYNIYYFSENLINILGHFFSYTGGAHGNYGTFTMVYLSTGGTLKQIKLADLFIHKSNYLKKLSDLCIEELKKKEASNITSEETTDLSKDLENLSFTITPGGITFYFDPYMVASYAEGPFEVNIPLTKIKDMFNKNNLTPEILKKIQK